MIKKMITFYDKERRRRERRKKSVLQRKVKDIRRKKMFLL